MNFHEISFILCCFLKSSLVQWISLHKILTFDSSSKSLNWIDSSSSPTFVGFLSGGSLFKCELILWRRTETCRCNVDRPRTNAWLLSSVLPSGTSADVSAWRKLRRSFSYSKNRENSWISSGVNQSTSSVRRSSTTIKPNFLRRSWKKCRYSSCCRLNRWLRRKWLERYRV